MPEIEYIPQTLISARVCSICSAYVHYPDADKHTDFHGVAGTKVIRQLEILED